jgi:hypothetical protein
MGIRAFAVAITVGVPSVAAAAPNDTSTIIVTYVNSLDRLNPSPQKGIITQMNLTVALSGQNTIQEKRDSRSGRNSRQSGSVLTLGGSATEAGERWRVTGPKQLVRRSEFPQNWTIITITVTGEKSCQAKIEYHLKPGFSTYTFRRLVSREIAYYSRAEVTSATCQIQ